MKSARYRTHRGNRSLTANQLKKKDSSISFFAEKKEQPFVLGLFGKGPNPPNAVNYGGPVALRGLTAADYSNNTWSLVNEKGKLGTDCENCTGKECVQYSAKVRSTFKVATTVTLPSMSEYADYTPCQKKRIKAAIQNELAPHEQKHVAAFKTYNGTVNTPFSITACRSELKSLVAERADEIHRAVEAPRRTSAQNASDALDPFVIHPDLNCK
ncbi:MAG: hypothetical protein GC192_20310 [Bacteroidetes bacterium]|nr:hypothetical protein [Bacteroidota bacterium]